MAHAKPKTNGQKKDDILKAVGVYEGDIPRAPEIEARLDDLISEKQSELTSEIEARDEAVQHWKSKRKEAERQIRKIRDDIDKGRYDSADEIFDRLQGPLGDLLHAVGKQIGKLSEAQQMRSVRKALFHKLRGRVYKCVAGRLRDRAQKWDQHKNIVEHREDILQAQKEARKTVERWQRHFDEDDPFLFKAGPWDVWMHDIEELVGLDEA